MNIDDFSPKDYDQVQAMMETIKEMLSIDQPPQIGIICGSGLGILSDMIEIQAVFPYDKLPHLPKASGN